MFDNETSFDLQFGTYNHVIVDGKRNDDAAWYYPEPKDAAKEIRGRIAFWKGVKVTD